MKNRMITTLAASLLIFGAAGCSVVQGSKTPSNYASDVELTSKVKADLLENGQVDGLDVNVDANDGKITLSGWASTQAEMERAAQVARQTEGVKSVKNNIQIKEK